MTNSPEASDHTSVQKRIQSRRKAPSRQPSTLAAFVGDRQDQSKGLPFRLDDYLELVDWTGRQFQDDKRGALSADLPPILERLEIEPKHWLYMTQHFESNFKGLVGSAYRLKAACQTLGYQRASGLSVCRQLLGT